MMVDDEKVLKAVLSKSQMNSKAPTSGEHSKRTLNQANHNSNIDIRRNNSRDAPQIDYGTDTGRQTRQLGEELEQIVKSNEMPLKSPQKQFRTNLDEIVLTSLKEFPLPQDKLKENQRCAMESYHGMVQKQEPIIRQFPDSKPSTQFNIVSVKSNDIVNIT